MFAALANRAWVYVYPSLRRRVTEALAMPASHNTDMAREWSPGWLSALVLAAVLAPGCLSGEHRHEPLVIFAAASLTDVFTAVTTDFEAAHPDIDVKVSFAGSQSLRTQIEQGARPQLFASANARHMDALHRRGLAAEPVIFAYNTMVIVVPAKNPAGITSVEDLPRAERIVLAGEAVPAGSYAERVLLKARSVYGADFASRINASIVSREPNVRAVLQKVVLGEADAAIVYASDARAAGTRVGVISIPRGLNVMASYPIAAVTGASGSPLGQQYMDYLLSTAGAATLERFGFSAARP